MGHEGIIANEFLIAGTMGQFIGDIGHRLPVIFQSPFTGIVRVRDEGDFIPFAAHHRIGVSEDVAAIWFKMNFAADLVVPFSQHGFSFIGVKWNG